jgi:multiple sugar transport system substrate-binding protein
MKVASLAVAVLALALADGARVSAAGSGEQTKLDQPAEIMIWGWPAADKAFEAIYPAFQKLHPTISVKWEMRAGGTTGVRDGLVAAFAAGTGAPDIAMIEINHIDGFVIFGGLANLLDSPFNAGRYKNDFVAYKWKQGSTPDGKKLFAFPWDIGPATVFYRRDLMDKAGVASSPEAMTAALKDWNGYLALGRKLNSPTTGVRWTDNASGVPYIYYSHKNFFDSKLNVAIDNPKTRQVLQVAKTVRKEGMDLKTNFWSEEWYKALNNGNVATTIVGCWFGGFLKSWIAKDTAGKWGIVPVPEDPLQNWGGSFMAIPEQSKNKLAAWKFIEFSMATTEAQNAVFQAVDYFPAYKPAWKDPLYEAGDPYFAGQKTRRMWADIANTQGPFVTTALDAAAEEAFTAELAKFLDQDLPIEPTIAAMVKAVENAVKEDKAELEKILKK